MPETSADPKLRELSPDEASQLERGLAEASDYVHAFLARHHCEELHADVLQDAFIAASQKIDEYDPDRGPLSNWVYGFCVNVARQHIRRYGKTLRELSDYENATTTPPVALTRHVGHDEIISEQQLVREELLRILSLAKTFIDNRDTYYRAYVAFVEYQDEPLSAAAAHLGIETKALAASKREFMRCAHVIRAALHVRETSSARPSMRCLLDCLPSSDKDGDWAHETARAAALVGGFDNVRTHHLVQATGWSENTCRQYLAEARHLIGVAYTIITTHNLTDIGK